MLKKNISFFLVLPLLFCGFLLAEDGWFGYSTLSFATGAQSFSYLTMNIQVGTGETGFWVDLANPTDEAIPLYLKFVSQVQSADSHSNKTCDMLDASGFALNLSGDTSLIVINSGQTLRKRVDFQFPACSSGVFLGCAVQVSSPTSLGDMDIVAGKVNFLDFVVHPSDACMPFSVKVYPGSRPGANYSNRGELKFYDMNHQFVASGFVETNIFGTGSFEKFVASGVYYVVYKGQSHLASYMSGLVVSPGSQVILDFTTGVNLYNIQNKSLIENDGSKYQIAGDMKNIQGLYDYVVNGNDISSIVYGSGLIEGGIDVLNPKNLNGDESINGADISIVGINFQQNDPFAGSSPFFAW